MKANVVTDRDDLINPGDILEIANSDGIIQHMIMVCPGCGKVSGGNHIFDPLTISVTPSIVHNKDLGGCGWHGHLTNGIFTPC
jgi:hypothetical protein